MRDAIDPGGEVLDSASPELKRIRNELRQKRQKLRGTLEQYTRGTARRSTCRTKSSPSATAGSC